MHPRPADDRRIWIYLGMLLVSYIFLTIKILIAKQLRLVFPGNGLVDDRTH